MDNSGIVTLQSGTPLGMTTQLSLPAIGQVRPDVVSNQFFVHKDRSSFDPGKCLYLNPAAFAALAPFTFGNAPRLFSEGLGPAHYQLAMFYPTQRPFGGFDAVHGDADAGCLADDIGLLRDQLSGRDDAARYKALPALVLTSKK